jgi:hypothetical protein
LAARLPLGLAAVINWLLLARGWIYIVLAAGQVFMALLALVARRGPLRLRGLAAARYCYYFLLLNWASAVALWRFLHGEKQILWLPRTG